MSSIIEGYEYDIFISYRQKDNKGDRWVSEFVDALKTELESTFKEEISVYFDINPHDGLLETHDVDASLKEKLKCLVFIPVISRTYCDPKSYAWKNEFKAFVKQASQDQFGLKIKLSNSNVANRVLPVRIHDLDTEDVKLFEEVTGGVMRTMDFVFKTTSGVNRPLKSKEDHPGDNLNKTYFQDQINKIALAIKEIIHGMKAEPVPLVKEKTLHREQLEVGLKETRIESQEKPVKGTKRKILSGIIIIAVLSVVSILAYPKLFRQNKLEKLRSSGERISIAVMPFQNMTNDTIWNVWQDGIQDNLINSLSNSEELKVRQLESITRLLQNRGLTNYAAITPTVASTISQKLDVNLFIFGSIKQAGTVIRVNAQLIDPKTEESFKSFQIDGTAENILHVIDSLSWMVKNFLIISKMEQGLSRDYQYFTSTNSPEAYRYFTYGQKAFLKSDFPTAINMYSQVLDIDSNFAWAAIMLSYAYRNQGLYDEARKWCLKIYEKRDKMTIQQKIFTNYTYALYFETTNDAIKYLRQLLELDDQMPTLYSLLNINYMRLHQYDKAIPDGEKALDIYKKWDSKPGTVWGYTNLGLAYHKTGQYKKEKALYKKAENDFPDDPGLSYREAILSLTEGDTIAANVYIEKYISLRRGNSSHETAIVTGVAQIYSEADIPDKAEKYYRQALSLASENPAYLNNLGWFLIDNDRNINEGLELVDKALKIYPENYSFLETKGWGLYKKAKYKDALEFLEKSWELKPVYDHDLYLHLEEAKKAIAIQK